MDNAGVAAARNLGIQLADSHYVAFLDADDLWHPLKIERQIAVLAAHGHSPEWGACYALHRMIDPLDNVLENGPSSHERGAFFEEHLVWNPVGNGSSLLVRRDLALAVDGFNSDYALAGIGGCEDLEFQLKLLRHSKIEVVREYLVGYRIHTAQMSGNIVMMRRSKVAVIEKIVADGEIPRGTRKRALVQAYLTLAKGFFLMHDGRGATKWVLLSLSISPFETARKTALFCRRELAYWAQRLRQGLMAEEEVCVQARNFADFEPDECVDASTRNMPRYRSSLQRRTEARSIRDLDSEHERTNSNHCATNH